MIINTKDNESFPSWHANDVLTFSGNGHGGEGGLDLYATSWNGKDGFRGLQHLAAPFNSSRDDLGLIIAADGMSGYMATDRKPTKGRDDLYRWTSTQSVFCTKKQEVREARELLVVDENFKPLSQSYIWFIPMDQEGPSLFKDNFSTELIPKPDKPGAFYLQWGITDTLTTATADALTNMDGRATYATDWKSTYILVVQHNGYTPFVEVFPFI